MKREHGILNVIRDKIRRSKKHLFDPRGAVTVFLTIILIPVITVTCVFVDMSRVQLSKAEAHSAADLSLFTLMSHYDEDLKEFYGIVASCQTKEDYIKKSTEYFKGMINAADSSGAGSTLFTAYANRLLTGDSISFLNAKAEEVNIAPLENSEFGSNPALIEDAIVEFMKYRGPVEIAARVKDRFSHIDLDQIDKANRYKPVSDAKEEYGEAESKLLEDAFNIYLVLKKYDDRQQETEVPSFKLYTDYEKQCKDLWTDYQSVTDVITKRYASTAGIKVINFPSIPKEEYCKSQYHFTKKEIGHLDSETGKYYLTSQTYNAIKQEIGNYLEGYIANIDNGANAVVSSVGGLKYEGSSMNETLYVRMMQELVSESDLYTIRSNGEKMLKLYARIKAALECEEDPEDPLPDNWDGPGSLLKNAQDDIHNAHKKYFTTEGNTEYQKIRKNYQSANPQDVVNKVNNRSYEFESKYLGKRVTLNTFATEVNQKYNSTVAKVDEQLGYLSLVLNGSGKKFEFNGQEYKITKLSKLTEEARDMSNKLDDWYNKAHSGSVSDITPVTEKHGDRESSEEAKKGYTEGHNLNQGSYYGDNQSERLAAGIDAESVEKLQKRLSNIKNDLQTYKDALTKLVYGGKTVKDLTNENVYIKAAQKQLPTKVKEMSLYLSNNETMARDAAGRLITPGQNDIYSAPSANMAETGNDPVIRSLSGHNAPELYKFLDDQFHDKMYETESAVDDAKKDQDEWKKKGKEAKEGSKSTEYAVGLGKNISHGTGGSQFGAGTGISSLVKISTNLVKGNFTQIRDQIYVCEYIMDMFTYSDKVHESKYRDSKLTVKNYPYSERDGEWNAENTYEFYPNQSLTNIPFNSKNNHAFLAEAEYILYGSGDNKKNLEKAYMDIYELRLALNLVSGFTNFWSYGKNSTADAINGIADAIAAATQGIVPAVLTKSILIGVLAALESAKDLEYLKKGASVTLYKVDHTKWFYAISQEGKKVKGFDSGKDTKAPEDEDGIYYSEYIYMFTLLGLTSGMYDTMLKRTADVIEANMRLQTGNKGWDKNKATMYYKLKSKVKVSPLMLTIPHIQSFGGSRLQEFKESDSWTTYDIELVRGYS